jgi:hypothetical protein
MSNASLQRGRQDIGRINTLSTQVQQPPRAPVMKENSYPLLFSFLIGMLQQVNRRHDDAKGYLAELNRTPLLIAAKGL